MAPSASLEPKGVVFGNSSISPSLLPMEPHDGTPSSAQPPVALSPQTIAKLPYSLKQPFIEQRINDALNRPSVTQDNKRTVPDYQMVRFVDAAHQGKWGDDILLGALGQLESKDFEHNVNLEGTPEARQQAEFAQLENVLVTANAAQRIENAIPFPSDRKAVDVVYGLQHGASGKDILKAAVAVEKLVEASRVFGLPNAFATADMLNEQTPYRLQGLAEARLRHVMHHIQHPQGAQKEEREKDIQARMSAELLGDAKRVRIETGDLMKTDTSGDFPKSYPDPFRVVHHQGFVDNHPGAFEISQDTYGLGGVMISNAGTGMGVPMLFKLPGQSEWKTGLELQREAQQNRVIENQFTPQNGHGHFTVQVPIGTIVQMPNPATLDVMQFEIGAEKQEAGSTLPPRATITNVKLDPEGIFLPNGKDRFAQLKREGATSLDGTSLTLISKDGTRVFTLIDEEELQIYKALEPFHLAPKLHNAEPVKFQYSDDAESLPAYIAEIDFIEGRNIELGDKLPENTLEKVAKALFDFHKAGFAHGDLHGGNLKINEDGNVFFFDFETSSREGSPRYDEVKSGDLGKLYQMYRLNSAEEFGQEQAVQKLKALAHQQGNTYAHDKFQDQEFLNRLKWNHDNFYGIF
jgi:hypothetical protein